MKLEDTRPGNIPDRDAALAHLLLRMWTYPITTKGDDARAFADEVAEGASRNYITTAVIPHGTIWGRIWKVTPDGLNFLFAHSDLLTFEEVRYVEGYCRGKDRT